MNDEYITIGASLLQHGKSSNRVYLMKLSASDYPQIITEMYKLAEENQYSKIIAKIPKWAIDEFEQAGYKIEAQVPKFYNGKDDAVFMANYLDSKRKIIEDEELIEEIITFTKNKEWPKLKLELPHDYRYGILNSEDVDEMAEVYKIIFKTYPFPIHDPQYLAETMRDNIVYFGIWDKDKLIAISSCEMDEKSANVEMTDFATLPEYQKQGLASFLLAKMDIEMKKRGILTAYTIARSVSYGMNITFAKHGYTYTGTLINNTDIAGSIECMNIWYKAL